MAISVAGSTYAQAPPIFLEALKREFTTVSPPAAGLSLRFKESSAGLPAEGSWRNALAICDINSDGWLDLVTPPQRGELAGYPHVFLQKKDGSWSEWAEVTWPRSVGYGTVVSADFNRDRHIDLAFAIHLEGLVVFLGNGRGRFRDASRGLPKDFPTRRAVITDLDVDGAPDLVAISEGPSNLANAAAPARVSGLRGFLNRDRASRWQPVDISGSVPVAGDWLAAADLNGDRKPDLVTSSIYFHQTDLLFLSQRDRWRPFGTGYFPRYSYIFAVGAIRRGREAEAVITYGRQWPSGATSVAAPEASRVVGIERARWEHAALVRTTIARWPSDRPVTALTVADFDGDGRDDIAFVHAERQRVRILVQRPDGSFLEMAVEGLELPANVTYDLRSADVNRDGRADLVAMFESRESRRDGSIRVYLSEGKAIP